MDETWFEALVRLLPPAEKLGRLGDELGIIERQSKIRLVELVTSAGRRQVDALRHRREATQTVRDLGDAASDALLRALLVGDERAGTRA